MKIYNPPYNSKVSPFSVDTVGLSASNEGFILHAERRNVFALLGEHLWERILEVLGHPCCGNGWWGKIFGVIERRLPISEDDIFTDEDYARWGLDPQDYVGIHPNSGKISYAILQIGNQFYFKGHSLFSLPVSNEDARALYGDNQERWDETWGYLEEDDD